LERWLQLLYQSLDTNGAILITDFGYTKPNRQETIPNLTTTYGVTTFCSIYFPFVKFVAEKIGFTTAVTQHMQGQSQSFLMIKGDQSQQICIDFKKKFETIHSENIAQLIIDVENLPKNKTLAKKIHHQLSHLSELEKEDYCLLTRLSLALVVAGDYDSAYEFALKSLGSCSSLALGSLELLGYIEKERGNLALASTHFKTLLNLSPDFPEAHKKLAFIFASQGNLNGFDSAIRRYLPYAKADLWDHLVTLLLIYIQTGKIKKAREILLFFQTCRKHHPQLIHPQIFEKVQQAQRYLQST